MSNSRFLLLVSLMTVYTLHVSYAQDRLRLSGGAATTLSGGATIHTLQSWDVGGGGASFVSDDGTVVFMGADDQILLIQPNSTFFNLTLDKPSGELTLLNDVAVQGTLTIQQGDLELHIYTIDLGTTGALLEPVEYTVKGSGGITAQRTLDTPAAENVAGLGAIITSNATLGETTITRSHAEQAGGGNESVRRYYDITPTNNTGLDATLTFSYRENELNGHEEDELSLYRSEDAGATWTERGGVVDTEAKTVTLTGIDAFSRWTLGSIDSPLPVELVSFEAFLDGASVQLQWQTASETNNAGFEIQHSEIANAISENVETRHGASPVWQALDFVDGHGTTVEAKSYAYRIDDLSAGLHTFRLKQIDYDGTFAYSPQVEVSVGVAGAYQMSAAYPNPFNPQTQFSLTVARAQEVTVAVYDVLGRRVDVLFRGEMAADHARVFAWEAGDRPSGLYMIRVVGERFTETRRVTLLK